MDAFNTGEPHNRVGNAGEEKPAVLLIEERPAVRENISAALLLLGYSVMTPTTVEELKYWENGGLQPVDAQASELEFHLPDMIGAIVTGQSNFSWKGNADLALIGKKKEGQPHRPIVVYDANAETLTVDDAIKIAEGIDSEIMSALGRSRTAEHHGTIVPFPGRNAGAASSL